MCVRSCEHIIHNTQPAHTMALYLHSNFLLVIARGDVDVDRAFRHAAAARLVPSKVQFIYPDSSLKSLLLKQP